MRIALTILMVSSMALLNGCGNDDLDAQANPTPEQIAERKATYEAELAREKRIADQLSAATDEQLDSLLWDCQNAIRHEAWRRYKGPYEIYVIDETSADSFQAAASYSSGSVDFRSIESASKRIEHFRHHGNLNTKFSVMTTHETFSGNKREFTNYSCKVGEDLTIDRVNRAY